MNDLVAGHPQRIRPKLISHDQQHVWPTRGGGLQGSGIGLQGNGRDCHTASGLAEESPAGKSLSHVQRPPFGAN
jgi:hypothetical protein